MSRRKRKSKHHIEVGTGGLIGIKIGIKAKGGGRNLVLCEGGIKMNEIIEVLKDKNFWFIIGVMAIWFLILPFLVYFGLSLLQ